MPSLKKPNLVARHFTGRLLPGITICFLFIFGGLSPLARASQTPELLVEIIASHNLALRQQSLEDETYRGEEGILRLEPEAAIKLGLNVLVTPEYQKASSLLRDAENDLRKAREAMETRSRESRPGEHAAAIADAILDYKAKTREANELLRAYAGQLDPSTDERLDRQKCKDLLIRILDSSLKKAGYRLRDALGCFVNTCLDVRGEACLTAQNVRFVNEVFREFVERAPADILNDFDLDRIDPSKTHSSPAGWKGAAGFRAAPIVSLVEESIERINQGNAIPLDPLLFIALIRQESQFDPQAVSIVGAAGLTQIMPKTGTDMGMENIYHPEYFDRAFAVLQEERQARREAMEALHAITPENREANAAKARELMQASIGLRQERQQLFSKYRSTLRTRPNDPRLHPEKSVEYGVRYFSGLLQDQNGDISLALASYNAGPHRVVQYNGIPPFRETVGFRNRVLEFYREYLDKLPRP